MKRNLVLCIIFSIITCGIYAIYWFIVNTNDANEFIVSNYKTSGIVALLLTAITGGLYGLYWGYKMGEKVSAMKYYRGYQANGYPVLFLVLQLLSLNIINLIIIQDEMNKYIDFYQSGYGDSYQY